MWTPLLSVDQIAIGSRIRRSFLDGEGTEWVEFEVVDIGQFFFLIQQTNTSDENENLLDPQRVTPIRITQLNGLNLTFWVDQ